MHTHKYFLRIFIAVLVCISAILPVSAEDTSFPVLTYQIHVENIGWMEPVSNNTIAGTTGQSLRLEALKVKIIGDSDLSISYRAYVENIGWQDAVTNGDIAGTSGRSLRIEALQMNLIDDDAANYDLYYCVHVQDYGWLNWAKNGEPAGTAEQSLRIEAIVIQLVRKGDPAPENLGSYSFSAVNLLADGEPLILRYSAHVQNIGWQNETAMGNVSGTTGRSLHLEAVNVNSTVNIEYRAHVQNIGWQDWVTANNTAGTTGRNLAIEALEFRLTGETANDYDLYYCVHASNYGWLSMAKNGEPAGTTGLSTPLEAYILKLVPKGESMPEISSIGYSYLSSDIDLEYAVSLSQSGWQDPVTIGQIAENTDSSLQIEGFRMVNTESTISGSVQYKVHVQDVGWMDWTADGETAGVSGKRIEALAIQFTGELATFFDVYYRTYVQDIGWTGWACNGSSSGSQGLSKGITAVQIMLRGKGQSAPGSTANAFYMDFVSNIKSASGAASLTSFGGYSLSSSAQTALSNALSVITASGNQVGFIMADLVNGKGVAYNPDYRVYSASTIKGPFIASLGQYNYDAIRQNVSTVQSILYYSNNVAYSNMWEKYGTAGLKQWCQELGIRTELAGSLYTYITARELGLLWTKCYAYFNSGAEGAELGSWYERPNVSPIYTQLSGTYTTRSKAGWIAESYPYICTNDAGIVYDGNHPYLISVVTNVGSNAQKLQPLVQALDQVHQEMK